MLYVDSTPLLGGSRGFRDFPSASRLHAERVIKSAQKRDVLISSEDLLGSPWDLYSGAAESAQALVERLASHVDSFQVITYLRPQHSWFQSAYAEAVKSGAVEKADSFATRLLQERYSSYGSLISDLRESFGSGNLVLRVYDPSTDVVAGFFQLLGVKVQDNQNLSVRKNLSLSPEHVELLRIINMISGASLDARLSIPGPDFFRRYAGNQYSKTSSFSSDMQQRLLDHTKADWETLPESVIGSRLAEPGVFKEMRRKLDKAVIREDTGSSDNRDALVGVACIALAESIPKAWKHEMHFGSRVQRKFANEMADVLPALKRRIIKSLPLTNYR